MVIVEVGECAYSCECVHHTVATGSRSGVMVEESTFVYVI